MNEKKYTRETPDKRFKRKDVRLVLQLSRDIPHEKTLLDFLSNTKGNESVGIVNNFLIMGFQAYINAAAEQEYIGSIPVKMFLDDMVAVRHAEMMKKINDRSQQTVPVAEIPIKQEVTVAPQKTVVLQKDQAPIKLPTNQPEIAVEKSPNNPLGDFGGIGDFNIESPQEPSQPKAPNNIDLDKL